MSNVFQEMAEALVRDAAFAETVTHAPRDASTPYDLTASVTEEWDEGLSGQVFVTVFAPVTEWTTAPRADDQLTIGAVLYRVEHPPVLREGAYEVVARVKEL